LRQTALELLALVGKNNPYTFVIIKRLAEFDDNAYVRRSAMQQLALIWHDEPGIFDFFCRRACSDPFIRQEDWEDNPRKTALEAIMEQYPQNDGIFQIFRDRAEQDLDEQVKQFAMKTLSKFG
ncbi:MAG: NTPase, partial [Trichodesmium sp.]